jgi:hypothetical protein
MQQFHGFLKKNHEIAKAVQKVTDFLDSPFSFAVQRSSVLDGFFWYFSLSWCSSCEPFTAPAALH